MKLIFDNLYIKITSQIPLMHMHTDLLQEPISHTSQSVQHCVLVIISGDAFR